MSLLSPIQAALIAEGVYTLREEQSDAARFGQQADLLNIDGLFGGASRFTGASGPLIFKKISGFGFIAAGVGKFQGDVLLATRGTDTICDWLTDFNIGVHYGSSGTLVHAGFYDTWKSSQAAISEFLRGRNPTRIHCVGHSLGGALAFLNADFLSANRIADVRVYTFGAPRVGVDMFARNFTERVGAENIYRVSNPCDPVPMIPIFPFFHAPYLQEGLQIPSTKNLIISGAGHSMKKSYVPSVGRVDWAHLRVAAPSEVDAKSWLAQSASGAINGVMGSSSLYEQIAVVMNYLLKICVAGIGLRVTAYMTVADQVASLLTRAAQISKEIKNGVLLLVRMIFRFLGRTFSTAVELTTAFLRWVLDLLMTSLRSAAHRALSMLR